MLQNVVVNDVAPEKAVDEAYEKAKQICDKHGLA